MNKKREELCAAALELAAARRKYADTRDYVAWLRRQPDDCGLSIGLYWEDACIARIKSAERRLERAVRLYTSGGRDVKALLAAAVLEAGRRLLAARSWDVMGEEFLALKAAFDTLDADHG